MLGERRDDEAEHNRMFHGGRRKAKPAKSTKTKPAWHSYLRNTMGAQMSLTLTPYEFNKIRLLC